jgi:shikimate kinase
MKSAASHCIALVGHRAAGKSTLGARLAAELKRPLFDLDREIELAQGRTIAALFRDEGEAAFREIEAQTLEGVIARPGIVLAPGGGAVERLESRRLLAQRAAVVHLDVPAAALVERLRAAGPRPRLTELSLEEETRTLLERRAPLYRECADVVVAVDVAEKVETTWVHLLAAVRSLGPPPDRSSQ